MAAIATAVAAACNPVQHGSAPLIAGFNHVYARMGSCRRADEAAAVRDELIRLLAQEYTAWLDALAPLSLAQLQQAWAEHTRITALVAKHVFTFANKPWPLRCSRQSESSSTHVMNRLFVARVLHRAEILALIATGVLDGSDTRAAEEMVAALECTDEISGLVAPLLGDLPAGDDWMRVLADKLVRFDQRNTWLSRTAFGCQQQTLFQLHLPALVATLGDLLAARAPSEPLRCVAGLLSSAKVDVKLLVPMLAQLFAADQEQSLTLLNWLAFVDSTLLSLPALRSTIVAAAAAALGSSNEAAIVAAKFVGGCMRTGTVDPQQWVPKGLFLPAIDLIISATAAKDVFIYTLWSKLSIELIRAFGKSASAFRLLGDQFELVLPVLERQFGEQTNLRRMLSDTTAALAQPSSLCNALVTTLTSWKLPQAEPLELVSACFQPYCKAIGAAEQAYHVKHSGRKLTWMHLMATAHARLDRKTIVMSLPQLAVLDAVVGDDDDGNAKRMCADTSVEGIAARTKMAEWIIRKAVEILKTHRIVETCAGGAVRLADTSRLSARPLCVAQLQPWSESKSTAGANEAGATERLVALQAVMVRALKRQHSVASPSALLELLATESTLKFQVTSAMVKTALDKLVETKYASVGPDNIITYIS